MRALVLGLILCGGGLYAQAIVNTSGAAGGGASAANDLSDVTITTATTDDVLKYNGAAWINKNLLTAIGEDLADGLATVASGSLGIASGVVTANAILTGPGNGNPRLVFTQAVGGPGYTFRSDTGTGFGSVATGQSGIWANSVLLASFGGSQTLLVQDTTSGSGDTLFEVWGGDTESGNLQVWGGDDEVADAYVTEAGAFTAISYGAPGAAIWYGASATEPVNCTASNDGSMYFDTGDQALCVCMNDGTDDEWLMSSDPAHATGHCTP